MTPEHHPERSGSDRGQQGADVCDWYIVVGEDMEGPMPTKRVVERIAASKARAHEVLVWHTGLADWSSPQEVVELRGHQRLHIEKRPTAPSPSQTQTSLARQARPEWKPVEAAKLQDLVDAENAQKRRSERPAEQGGSGPVVSGLPAVVPARDQDLFAQYGGFDLEHPSRLPFSERDHRPLRPLRSRVLDGIGYAILGGIVATAYGSLRDSRRVPSVPAASEGQRRDEGELKRVDSTPSAMAVKGVRSGPHEVETNTADTQTTTIKEGLHAKPVGLQRKDSVDKQKSDRDERPRPSGQRPRNRPNGRPRPEGPVYGDSPPEEDPATGLGHGTQANVRTARVRLESLSYPEKRAIANAVMSQAKTLVPCVKSVRGKLPRGKYTIIGRWTINVNGAVSQPRLVSPTAAAGTSLPACFSRIAATWTFPARKNAVDVSRFTIGRFTVGH